jgi:hypothetical protein
VLTETQVQSLSVEKLVHLSHSDHIALIGNHQIQQMTKVHAKLIAQLTDGQISGIALFPKHLIKYLPVEKLPSLCNTQANLTSVPEDRHIHLSDEQLRILYGNQFPNRAKRVLQGLVLSTILVPRLAIEFLLNSIKLFIFAFFAIFSAAWRESFAWQAGQTFVHAPARAFSGIPLVFDYLSYVKIHLKHGNTRRSAAQKPASQEEV